MVKQALACETTQMAHEDLRREEVVEGSSNRSFGLVFAVVFGVVCLLPLLHAGAPRWWAAGVSLGFALVALAAPKLLTTPNRLWMRLGLLLGKVVSPIALGVLFYLILAPVGVVLRLTGKDLLSLKRSPHAKSYWMARNPPGPPPDSMTNQF